uniref:Uncharacterized protein n=1 Tax=Utricularia reniformis TaxID=192314 RepID=A0A1Y0B3Y9_9LAMI|nr:hypothetical protein AEK19_MT1969 [Utricularia reniformis]ART32132.1 hypothetical protein AEK19_MT1969 [Utricularia reniformis]
MMPFFIRQIGLLGLWRGLGEQQSEYLSLLLSANETMSTG